MSDETLVERLRLVARDYDCLCSPGDDACARHVSLAATDRIEALEARRERDDKSDETWAAVIAEVAQEEMGNWKAAGFERAYTFALRIAERVVEVMNEPRCLAAPVESGETEKCNNARYFGLQQCIREKGHPIGLCRSAECEWLADPRYEIL